MVRKITFIQNAKNIGGFLLHTVKCESTLAWARTRTYFNFFDQGSGSPQWIWKTFDDYTGSTCPISLSSILSIEDSSRQVAWPCQLFDCPNTNAECLMALNIVFGADNYVTNSQFPFSGWQKHGNILVDGAQFVAGLTWQGKSNKFWLLKYLGSLNLRIFMVLSSMNQGDQEREPDSDFTGHQEVFEERDLPSQSVSSQIS